NGFIDAARLQTQHAGNELETVFDAMIHFLEQHLLAIERRLEPLLVALALNGHAENIRRALQERQVVLAEFSGTAAVDLQHTERCTVALEDDVDRPADAILEQQLGSTKALFLVE